MRLYRKGEPGKMDFESWRKCRDEDTMVMKGISTNCSQAREGVNRRKNKCKRLVGFIEAREHG